MEIEGRERIGKVGFDLLDQIEKMYDEDAAPVKINQVIVTAEVEYTDEEGDRSTHVLYDYDEHYPLRRQGLVLNLAKATGVIV